MSEAGDFEPGHWKGHDFKAARKTYDIHVGRSYDDAKVAKKDAKSVIPKSLSTKSRSPLTILCDVTGSMGEWPAVIFSKLPYLELEGQEYLGKDMEIGFGAVGDAYEDDYPLQGRPYAKGTDLKKRLEELVIEKGGGGQTTESYELAALYYARQVSMPNAIHPILIIIGDEAPYDFVNGEQAEQFAYTKLQGRISLQEVFDELKTKYEVYLIRKPYELSSSNAMSAIDQRIYRKWREVLDEEHIADLPEAQRVVDVIFGILAKETGRIEYFHEELEGRQKPDQVGTVYKSLETIHVLRGEEIRALPAGRSTIHRRVDGTPVKSLL